MKHRSNQNQRIITRKIFQYLKMYQVQRSQNYYVRNISIKYRYLTVGAI